MNQVVDAEIARQVEAEGAVRDEHVFNGGGMHEQIGHIPLGVVANISAWNYPYFVGANVFVPALLTGNAVLYKPSEFATLTGLEIGKLLQADSGVPAVTAANATPTSFPSSSRDFAEPRAVAAAVA